MSIEKQVADGLLDGEQAAEYVGKSPRWVAKQLADLAEPGYRRSRLRAFMEGLPRARPVCGCRHRKRCGRRS